MKKRNWLLVAVLVVAMSLGTTLSAGATGTPPEPPNSTGTFETDCVGASFSGTVADGELGRLEVRLHDPLWQDGTVQNDVIVIDPGTFDVTVPWVTNPDGRAYRVAFSASTDGGQTWTTIKVEEGYGDCPPPPGDEGCSPGYFKKHTEDWAAAGYSPGDDFDTEFGTHYFDPDITLLEAVNAKGGGVNKLARHGTAALLSAAHPDVAYPYSVAEVIAMVQAGDADPLAAANDLGCEIP